MKISIYILGFLIKHGPQHGYNLLLQINKTISTFTKIKMPSLYYHLEKMQKDNFISVSREQEGNRPERFVYSITDKGLNHFQDSIEKVLNIKFDIEFLLDSVFLFWNTISIAKVYNSLSIRLHDLEQRIFKLSNKKDELPVKKSTTGKIINEILFKHHELHYKAEIDWLKDTISILSKTYYNKNKSYLSEKI